MAIHEPPLHQPRLCQAGLSPWCRVALRRPGKALRAGSSSGLEELQSSSSVHRRTAHPPELGNGAASFQLEMRTRLLEPCTNLSPTNYSTPVPCTTGSGSSSRLAAGEGEGARRAVSTPSSLPLTSQSGGGYGGRGGSGRPCGSELQGLRSRHPTRKTPLASGWGRSHLPVGTVEPSPLGPLGGRGDRSTTRAHRTAAGSEELGRPPPSYLL